VAPKKPFKLCILFGDDPARPPAEIGPGWEMAEIPVSILLEPFASDAVWKRNLAEVKKLKLPPIKASSHFLSGFGLVATGPNVDFPQLKFWTERAFNRLADVGVEVAGVYGDFFPLVKGFSRQKLTAQAERFVNLLGDHAKKHKMLVALEPMDNLNTLWPRYKEGLAFAKRIDRPEIRVMADLAYFIKLKQNLEDIEIDPDYCLHVHMAGVGGQPGLGDRVATHTRLFEILKRIGYTRGVSAACPWNPSRGKTLNFGYETARTLKYLKALREKVYAK
jgi:hypothetical protein